MCLCRLGVDELLTFPVEWQLSRMSVELLEEMIGTEEAVRTPCWGGMIACHCLLPN